MAARSGGGGGGGGGGGASSPPKSAVAVDEDLVCSICTALCEIPVTTSCGHSYCKPCLSSWLSQGRSTCPNCRASIPSTVPAVSIVLQGAIEALKALRQAGAGSPALAAPPRAPDLAASNAAEYSAALQELGSKASKACLANCWASKRAATKLLLKIDEGAVVSPYSYATLERREKHAGVSPAKFVLRAAPAHESSTLSQILREHFEAGTFARPAELDSNPVFSQYATFEDLLRWARCLWPETLRLCDLKEAKALVALGEHECAWAALERDAKGAWELVEKHLRREAAVAEAVSAANAHLREAHRLGLSLGSDSVPPALLPTKSMEPLLVVDMLWASLESEAVVREGLALLNSDALNAQRVPLLGALLPCLIFRHMALEDVVVSCATLVAKIMEGGASMENMRCGYLSSLAAGARACQRAQGVHTRCI